jgi:hypothetical protein
MRVTFLTLPLAVAAALVTFGISAGPAAAAVDPTVCTDAPAALRTLAASAEPAAARKALRDVQTGEALCEARNRNEAAKKFRAAADVLGTDLATVLATVTRTASVQ